MSTHEAGTLIEATLYVCSKIGGMEDARKAVLAIMRLLDEMGNGRPALPQVLEWFQARAERRLERVAEEVDVG